MLARSNKIESLSQAKTEDEALLGHMMLMASKIAKEKNIEGYRIVINEGKHG